MRSLIDLVEDDDWLKKLLYGPQEDRLVKPTKPVARPVKSGPFANFLEQVYQEAEDMLGVPRDEIDTVDVRDWLTKHRSVFHRKRASVYRVMRVPEMFITDLKAGAELGQHWSFDFKPDNIEEFDTSGEGELFLFTCNIDAADIALALTVAYNCVFPHEEEVFINRVGTPIFQSVQKIVDWQADGINLRPDLVGSVMHP